MGYRDDQFYKLYPGALQNAPSNKEFLFPGKTSRKLTSVSNDTKQVKRGFMTSLLFDNQTLGLTPAEKQRLKTRLNFQFNPTVITQQVANSEDMMLPFLQNPGNWATPVMSNNNFYFELFLDRQFEANQSENRSFPIPGNPPAEDIVINLDRINPTQVGVMADLAVLYRLIGQGLDATTMSIFRKLSERSQAYSSDPADTSAFSSAVPITEGTGSQRSPIDQNINAGNYAFIAALPVRIVFSSLFMVDGFVTSTAVRFTKFNANMVPVQCTVSISMQAMYIGFAREKTAFTVALSDDTLPAAPTPGSPGASPPSGGTPATPGPKVGDPADAKKLKEFESKILKRFRIAVSDKFIDWNKNPGIPVSTPAKTDLSFDYTLRGILGGNWLYCFMGFPLISGSKDDIIAKYLREGNRMSINYSFNANITRPGFAPDEPPTVFLGAFSGDSSMSKDSGGSPIIDSEKKWKSARYIATTDDQVVISVPPDPIGSRSGLNLYLPNAASFQAFCAANKQVTVTLTFRMEVKLMSTDKGETSRTYDKVLTISNTVKPDRPIYMDYTFDTISTGSDSTGPR